MTHAKIDPQLQATLSSRSVGPLDLIIRVDEANDETAAAVESMGFEVRHRVQLLPSFAVSGPRSAVAALADQPWVLSIEEDRPVHTM